jgi:hypothetical protein
MIIVLLLFATIGFAAPSQQERCAPADYEKTSDMVCVNRNGHCAVITVDGQTTVPLSDETLAARVHSIKHGEDVCWQLTNPVSTTLHVSAKPGGINSKFLGNVQGIQVNLYHLDDYDPDVDSRLDSLSGVSMESAGPGVWEMRAENKLPAGEYVAVFRLDGTNNWDKQAVLLKLDPAMKPK